MNERDELVAQLRGWDHCWPAPWLETAVADAAAQIERDGRGNQRLREALKRIESYRRDAHEHDDDMGHLRRCFDVGSVIHMETIARAALNGEGET